jgi:hypothetical protein
MIHTWLSFYKGYVQKGYSVAVATERADAWEIERCEIDSKHEALWKAAPKQSNPEGQPK